MPSKLREAYLKSVELPSEGSKTIWDSEIRGFGVRIFAPTDKNPHGARSFFLNYRADGRERRYTIGLHPTWSVEAARDEAKALRRRVDKGEDPAAAKHFDRDAPTVRDLADRYTKDYLPSKADRSQVEDQAMIDNEIIPQIGNRKVASVHIGDIEELHRSISSGGPNVPGRPIRANRVLSVVSRMFSLSLKPLAGEEKPWRDQVLGNPCKGVRRNPEHGSERFFSDRELAALSDALALYPGRTSANCVRFIMLTGCRPGEAMKARWKQLDEEPSFWVKPSAHTKQRRTHRTPLSPAALELVDEMRSKRPKDADENSWVFVGQKKGDHLKQLFSVWSWVTARGTVLMWSDDPSAETIVDDLHKALHRLPSVAECKAEAKRRGITLQKGLLGTRVYDLRHTFASVGAGGGLSLQLIGRLLGHTQARTTQRYAHLADDPLREATKKISNAITGAGKGGSNIVGIRGSGAV